MGKRISVVTAIGTDVITEASQLPITDTGEHYDSSTVEGALQEAGAQLSAIDTQLADKANKAQEDWITPTLAAPWVELSTVQKPGYYKDSIGIVRLKGLVKSGTVNTTIFWLPVGYIPSKDVYFVIIANDKIGEIVVNTVGAVSFRIGETAWVSLDQITFKAV